MPEQAIESIPMQVTIGGMSARPGSSGMTLFGELDVATGLLLIDEARSVAPGVPVARRGECAMLTNDATAPDYDALFTDADIRAAITDYYSFQGRSLLMLEDAVRQFDPGSKIEPDGIDEHGRKFRVAPDISDGQVAVMVMCWFAMRQTGTNAQIAVFDELADMTLHTVGMGGRTVHAAAGNPLTRGYTMGGQLAIGADGWPV